MARGKKLQIYKLYGKLESSDVKKSKALRKGSVYVCVHVCTCNLKSRIMGSESFTEKVTFEQKIEADEERPR